MREVLEELFARKAIQLERGPLFDHHLAPLPPEVGFDQVEGMMLGLAIGDSLGITSEGVVPRERKRRHGEIRDYLPNRHNGDPRGYPSDDTQLAFWTLDQLVQDGGFVPERLAARFANSGRIFGIGRTMRQFLANLNEGISWDAAGPHSAGNGALMRIAPMIVPHLRTGGTDVWVDVALSAMMMHNDRASTASCLAFACMLRELLEMRAAPDPSWWRRRFVELAAPLEGDGRYTPRGGAFTNYTGPLSRFVDEKLAWAEHEQVPTVDACNAWYSGAFLLETVPCVLLVLTRYGHDPEEAIVQAVNDTRDNDTVAAIVGACVGALHGHAGLPVRWVDGLVGWTTVGDDGRVFEILKDAERKFDRP